MKKPKAESIILRGGPRDGVQMFVSPGVRFVVVPLLIPGQPGICQCQYERTERFENGFRVYE